MSRQEGSTKRLCSVEDCTRPHQARGYCKAHWRHWRKGKTPQPLRPARAQDHCDYPGCPRPHLAKGWCRPHYDQQWRGEELQDIRPRRKPPNEVFFDDDGAYIPLYANGGHEKARARVSMEDIPRLLDQRWYSPTNGYVYASPRGEKSILLHRLVMDAPDSLEVDHIDGDPLNNRRGNLRFVTRREQMQNLGVNKLNNTGHRNVHKHPGGGFKVQVVRDGKVHQGGWFADLEEAAEAARELRAKLYTHHNETRCSSVTP